MNKDCIACEERGEDEETIDDLNIAIEKYD
jgi:hypothetical protein